MIPTRSTSQAASSGAMVLMLPLVLIPLVVSGFFTLYALVGGIVDGDDLLRWQHEALRVSIPTAVTQITMCIAIIVYARLRRRLSWVHPANSVNVFNILLTLVLFSLVIRWTN